jgi:sugar lactone lactonase YvrE
MSLAKGSSGATIAAIDGVGSLHILAAKDDGSMKELYMSSPHAPIVQAEVLRGGNKVITLSADHKVVLMDQNGAVLTSLQERRFSPDSLKLSGDEKTIIAISTETMGMETSATLRPLTLNQEDNTLTLGSDEVELDHIADAATKRLTLSPDGQHFAYLGFPGPEEEAAKGPTKPVLERKNKRAQLRPPQRSTAAPSLMIAKMSDGSVQKADLNVPAREIKQVALGFVTNDSLVVSSRPSGGSWKVQLGETLKTLPLQAVVANDPQRSAHAFAEGLHLAADGTWLYVQDPIEGKHHYLGYTAFDPQYASISPSSEQVAWTNNAMIYVESIDDDTKSLRITAAPSEAYYRAAFIDDEHLVAIDYSGGLHLVDWTNGKEIGELDTGGSVREFEVDQERKLIRGIRQNGGSWVVEFGDKGLAGPYLIRDNGFRSGFLKGDLAVWTIDSANRYHSYRLDALRKGLSPKDLEANATKLSSGAPVAIDSAGTQYLIRNSSGTSKLSYTLEGATKAQLIELPWTPLRTMVSPDVSKIALVSSNGGIVSVYDRSTGKSLWSVSFVQGVRDINWSKDSQNLAVASQIGAVVYAADSGKELRLGCGHWFEKRSTPPPSTASFLQVLNLCER